MPHHVVWEMHFVGEPRRRLVAIDQLIRNSSVLGVEHSGSDGIFVTLREGFVDPVGIPDWDRWVTDEDGYHVDFIGQGFRYRVAPDIALRIYIQISGEHRSPAGGLEAAHADGRDDGEMLRRGVLSNPYNREHAIPYWNSVVDTVRGGHAGSLAPGTEVLIRERLNAGNGWVLRVSVLTPGHPLGTEVAVCIPQEYVRDEVLQGVIAVPGNQPIDEMVYLYCPNGTHPDHQVPYWRQGRHHSDGSPDGYFEAFRVAAHLRQHDTESFMCVHAAGTNEPLMVPQHYAFSAQAVNNSIEDIVTAVQLTHPYGDLRVGHIYRATGFSHLGFYVLDPPLAMVPSDWLMVVSEPEGGVVPAAAFARLGGLEDFE